MNELKKHCLGCKNAIYGRSDKIFCSDYCRNSFHTKKNKEEYSYIKTINSILKKNRQILQKLNKNGYTNISKEALQNKGFNFNYFTYIHQDKKETYFFCYEQGYFKYTNGSYILVSMNEHVLKE